MLNKYFESFRKYDSLLESQKKMQHLLESGNLSLSSETPFPVLPRNQSVRISPPLLKPSIRKKTSPSSSQLSQITNRNKRTLESLLGKYQRLSCTSQKSSGQQSTRVYETVGRKICEYEQILQRASHRLPLTRQEEDLLAESPHNMRLADQMERDLLELKQYAQRLNCSLHRKDKYYECIDVIRRKMNLMPSQEEKGEKFFTAQLGRGKGKEVVVPLQRRRGREYLSFSKEVGVGSRERYLQQRGRVRLVREVVHNWWFNSKPAPHSSLS